MMKYVNLTVPENATESVSTTELHHAIPPQAHHFTFALDLRSIRDFSSTNTIFVFLRFVKAFDQAS